MMSEKAEGKLGGRFHGRHGQDWEWGVGQKSRLWAEVPSLCSPMG